MKKWLRTNWQFILFCGFALGIRFINFEHAAYFIYDVGRDATALKTILSGDLKLVGPTTGLPGFFLGPLWYYIGLPGYVLSNGSPYGIQLWYIFLSSLFIPIAWVLSHKLFGNTVWAKISALLLVLSSGSISGTNFVWNPMLSLPLMAGSLLALMNSRNSARSLYLGIFLLALTLQSEFAYAIFFLVTLWPLIPWLRGRFEWKTLVISAGIILITLLPQLGFEIRHNFSMTKSLLASMADPTMKVSQSSLWQHRPKELWNVTLQFVGRDMSLYPWLSIGFAVAIMFGVIGVTLKQKYQFRLLMVLTFLPYVYYLFWRGNYGYFFDYYVTPHFILVIPFVVFGLKTLYELNRNQFHKTVTIVFVTIFLTLAGWGSYQHLNALILRPNNQAGLAVMERAVDQLYQWSLEEKSNQAVFRIYTPNVYTDHYDFITGWLSKSRGYSLPLTVQSKADAVRYVLYESTEGEFRQAYFLPWYSRTTDGFKMSKQEQFGVLTVEKWAK